MNRKLKYIICASICLFLNTTLCHAQTAGENSEDWITNPRGMVAVADPNFILPPFDPIIIGSDGGVTVCGQQVAACGRTYYLNSLGLIQQVNIQGTPYFAQNKGMDLEIDIDGTKATLKPLSQILLQNYQGRVVYFSEASFYINNKYDGVLQMRTTIEYDGMVREDMTLVPQGKINITHLSYNVYYSTNNAVFLRWDSALLASSNTTRNVPKETFSMRLPATSGILWQQAFKTGVWIGDYSKGFLWFCGSEQNWSPQPRANRPGALTVSRTSAGVQLTVTPVSQSYSINQPITYTFGMFATPVRPYPDGWRGFTQTPYPLVSFQGNILFADQTIWAKYPFYPQLKSFAQITDLVAQQKKLGRLLLPYLDPATMTSSSPVPELKYHDEWQTLPGMTWKYYSPNTQYRVSAFSHWVDFYCYEIEQMAKTGINGAADIDEWETDYDLNAAHGAGYIDQNGVREPTYDVWAKRDFAKRLNYIFLKGNGGVPPLIIGHSESMMDLSFMSFASIVLTGENSNTNYYFSKSFFDPYSMDLYNQTNIALTKNPAGIEGYDWYYYAYSLDRWQAEDLGIAFGLPVMVMSNLMKSPLIDPNYGVSETATRDFLSMTIVHDNLVWPLFINTNVVKNVWAARQNFDITDPTVTFEPYWGNKHIATTPQSRVYISAYNKNNSTWLLCISNLSLIPLNFPVQINLPTMQSTITSLSYAIKSQNGTQQPGEEIPVTNSSFMLQLKARDFTMIVLKIGSRGVAIKKQ